jgi:hypothetical protein
VDVNDVVQDLVLLMMLCRTCRCWLHCSGHVDDDAVVRDM